MIRNKQKQQTEIVIDLTGPDGNVFVLMGYARRFARQLKELWEEEMVANRTQNVVLRHMDVNPQDLLPETLADQICREMMASDYENAVQVFDRYFGSWVTLER